jgi:hypothetical protein
MNRIKNITPKAPLTLICQFENGISKSIDLSSIKDLPVFSFLKNEKDFLSVVNKGYFIEWVDFEADLSADTLWNWGKT